MVLKRFRPNVLIVPSSLVLELFSLARFATTISKSESSAKILFALRRLRPDVPEFSSYYAMALMEEGRFGEATEILEEYLASGFDECSLVYSLLAYLRYKNHDPRWAAAARHAVELVALDGGSAYQRELLEALPEVDVEVEGSRVG